MGSFISLGIILSCVFGVILLGLVAELYYFWWKKRLNNTEIEDQHIKNNYAKYYSFFFCWKKPISTSNSELNSTAGANGQQEEDDLEVGNSTDTLLKGVVEESVESELSSLHNLCGPPRFLFTIKEETKEDLFESEDVRSRKNSRTRSLSDLFIAVDPPLTPVSSPPIKISPLQDFDQHGFNLLFEADLDRLRSSPPPKFKFLRDAEEKLMKRLVGETEKRALKCGGCVQDFLEKKDGSFVSLWNANKQKETEICQQEVPIQPSGPSKVLPLATSTSTFRPLGLTNLVGQ